MKHTLGADPEFVILDANNQPVAAPVALKNPNNLEVKKVNTRFGDIFPDNVNIEASINYADTKAGFRRNVKGVIEIASNLVKPQGYTIHSIASLDWPIDQLKHPLCKQFGCDPDYNSFTVSMNEISSDRVKQPFRTAGGHLHIGSSDEGDFLHDFQGRIDTVNVFELIAGIPSLFLDNNEASIKRRSLYGGAGAHRPKDYGVECRSLSNFWCKSPKLVDFAYTACDFVLIEMREKNLKTIDLMRLPNIINNGDLRAAEPIRSEIFDQYEQLQEAYEVAYPDSQIDPMTPLSQTWKL